ncbi:MAG: hercynine metabolism small protein [Cyanobacteriota bacterium]|nr:hercynine metabolism small protein [Cyanobacteriota bacterium]
MSRDDWSRDDQRQVMRQVREGLIEELEGLYLRSFERLSELELGEGAIARLTQLLLRSREAALTPLRDEIEAPLITQAPGERTGEER